MTKLVPLSLALTLAAASAAFAQTSTTTTPPATPPAATPPATTAPSTTSPSSTTSPTAASRDVILTEEEAKKWIDKTVYSSDNQNVGEVAAFNRDSSGKVTEMHADVGGFLGLGETRVRLMPGEFTLSNDRVVLNLSSDAVKSLPHIPK